MSAVFLDGREAEACSIHDRGLHYGDGLFETLAVTAGRPCLWRRHLTRLERGCIRLRIPVPDTGALLRQALRLSRGVERGVLKILVTRGPGGEGYAPPPDPEPSVLLILRPWPETPPEWRREGVRVRTCRTRLGTAPALAGLKHLNRLEQVLARGEWDDPGIAEGLMRDVDGWVVEGTRSNLFLVRDGALWTPVLDRCGVAGVMRELVLGVSRELGLEVREARIDPVMIEAADALFLTNSLMGLWPVRELDGRPRDTGAIPAELVQAVAEHGFVH